MKKNITVILFVSIFLLSDVYSDYSVADKSHVRAFFLSFALPGLGQYYAGSSGNAKIFIASEIIMWSALYYNTVIQKSYHNDYLFHASSHAGVNPKGFGTSYLNALGSYQSSYEYNQYQKKVSYEPVLYTGDKMWNWDENENRLRFKNLRERELDFKNYIKYCTAGIILNHFLAGLNASKIVQNNNKTNTALNVNVIDRGLSVNYLRSF
ncbi:hypothetical protein ACFL6H_08225 [Candidatus Latescibacterota bacterium]